MSEIKKLRKEKYAAISQKQYEKVVSICNAIGHEYLKQERYDEALEYHLEELEYSEKIDDQLGKAVAYRWIGECYAHLNDFKKAEEHVKRYHDIAVSLKSTVEEQRALTTLGRTYYLKYQYECASDSVSKIEQTKTLLQSKLADYKALKLLYKLKSEVKPAELKEMECRLLLNLGLICETRRDSEESFKYVNQALGIALENNLYEDIYRCSFALGTFYEKIGSHNEADKVLSKAVTVAEKLHDKISICEAKLTKSISLISLEKYGNAKSCLKSAYKMCSPRDEDREKIIKALKVSIGIMNSEKSLKACKNYKEKKIMLEKIADGLSSIGCYKLAIKKYLASLDCMKKYLATLECMQYDSSSQLAPIYFSLAQTYSDDGNFSKALEYFKKEYACNAGKPLEQILTKWKMAELWEEERNFNESEECYLKVEKCNEKAEKCKLEAKNCYLEAEKCYFEAKSLAESAKNQRFIHDSLSKLLSFYERLNKTKKARHIKDQLNTVKYECLSDDDQENDEGSQEAFNEINLSELSDSDDNEETISTTRKRSKKIESKVNEKGETPLHEACISGNLSKVEKLIQSGHSVNVRDNAGWTPLHEACNYGFYDIVQYLLEKGADINDPGPKCDGITPLHDAAAGGNLDVMQLLIARGASVTAVDKTGETPLQALVKWKKTAIKDQDLNDVTLRHCKAVEEELKSKMIEAGVSVNEELSEDAIMSSSSDSESQSPIANRKRNRSPNLTSESDVSEENIRTPPYLNRNNDQDRSDADEAKAEYKSVMEILRHSAAAISPVKSPLTPKVITGPLLVNENEIVNDWLIKDTREIPKSKRKRRRINKLNVRTSKCIDKFLIHDSSNEEESRVNPILDEDSNISIASVNSVDKNKESPPKQSLKPESLKVNFCLRVHVADKLILVPVPDDNCTVNWLKEEAALRFQNLECSKPELTLMKNDAILTSTDLVKSIFSNNEEVFSSVEMWEEPSLEDKYTQLCNKRKITVSSSVKKRFECFKTSSELNFSNCMISYPHLSVIFCTMLKYKSIVHLNFSGTALSDKHISELISCIPSFSLLATLNLSCCCLTSQAIKILIDYLKNQISHDVVLPLLTSLDLSYNDFTSCSSFTVLLKLNSLVSLNLSSCGLNSDFFSNDVIEAIKEKQSLENFDVSGNVLGDTGVSDFLHCLPRRSLRTLNLSHVLEKETALGSKLQTFLRETLPFLTELSLQGCYLTNTDVIEISECLSNCPQLQICDLSANPALSSFSLCTFINKASEHNLHITDFIMTGTCVWHDYDYCSLADFVNLKTLKHLCFDNCPEKIAEKVIELWRDKWESRAFSTDYGFYELSVK